MQGYRWNPMEMQYDDTVCVVCGKKLMEDPPQGTTDFDGFCSNLCEENAREAEADTMLPLYEPEEPKTKLVYVRWEGDEEETPVMVTASEYEVLRELVNEEVL